MLDSDEQQYCIVQIPGPTNDDTRPGQALQLNILLDFPGARQPPDGVRLVIVQQKTPALHFDFDLEFQEGNLLQAFTSWNEESTTANTLTHRSFLNERRRRRSSWKPKDPIYLALELRNCQYSDSTNKFTVRTVDHLLMTSLEASDIFNVLFTEDYPLLPFDQPRLNINGHLLTCEPEPDPTLVYDDPPENAVLDEPLYSFHVFLLKNRQHTSPDLPVPILEGICLYALGEAIHLRRPYWLGTLFGYARVKKSWLPIRDLCWKLIGNGTSLPNPGRQLPALADLIPSLGNRIVPYLQTLDTSFHRGNLCDYRSIMFSRVYIRAARNLRSVFISPDIFYASRTLLRTCEQVETFKLIWSSREKGAQIPTWEDILSCIQDWSRLASLAISLDLLDHTDEKINLTEKVDFTVKFRLKSLALVNGHLSSSQLLSTLSGLPPVQLKYLRLYRVTTLTTDDLWNVFEIVHLSLETLVIECCDVSHPKANSGIRSAHALDAFIESMPNIRSVTIDGDLMTSQTIGGKQRITDQEPSTLDIRTPYKGVTNFWKAYGIDEETGNAEFLDAIKRSGWDVIFMRRWPGRWDEWDRVAEIALEAGTELVID